jgi:hypothetical protein
VTVIYYIAHGFISIPTIPNGDVASWVGASLTRAPLRSLKSDFSPPTIPGTIISQAPREQLSPRPPIGKLNSRSTGIILRDQDRNF